MSNFRYFHVSVVFSLVCVAAAWGVGFAMGNGHASALAAVFIVSVLAVLEISLSFDNAVVNAKVLAGMDPVWRARFITWGILIAVFGMRIILPLIIVGIGAGIWPWQALELAISRPADYAMALRGAHVPIAAFGASFLAMVGLKFFMDRNKDIHWVHAVEAPMTRMGKIEAVEIALVILALYGVSRLLPEDEVAGFLLAGMMGIVCFVGVEAVATLLGGEDGASETLARQGAAGFLYLEVLDASFSFDGVIGAFALTDNLFIIALGLGIGAMFVRSLTIMLVDKGTLAHFLYLEHGAYWAIIALAGLMMAGTVTEIPEVATGLIGAALIGLSLLSSIRRNRRDAA